MADLYAGAARAADVRVGAPQAAAVYLGNTLIWSPKTYYLDNFSRATLGAAWRTDQLSNPSAVISDSTRLQAGSVANNTGRQAASWATYVAGQFGTDNQYVRAQLTDPSWGRTGDCYTSIFLAGDSTLTHLVSLTCSTTARNGTQLIHLTGGTPNGVGNAASGGSRQRTVATVDAGISRSSQIELQRRGNQFDTYVDGVAMQSETIAVGSGYRYWGVCVEALDPLFGSQSASQAIYWIEAGDL
jgi:hypothetical protein